jgi:hypothetical protein
MTHKERAIYLNGLTSSLTLQLAIALKKDALIQNKSEGAEHESPEEAHIFIAGFRDGNELASEIISKL